jgi:hypothetical protein
VPTNALPGAPTDAASGGEPQQPPDADTGVPSSPATGPVKVELVSVPDPPEPKKDLASRITNLGSFVITALALIVAFVSVVYQRQSNDAAQASAQSADAAEVFIIQQQSSSTFEIEDLARAPIYSVWLYPAPHDPLSLGTLRSCSISTFVLTPASKPVIYFKDANGVSWERTISGKLQHAVNPSSVVALLPLGAESAFSRSISVITTTSSSCS